MTKAHAGITTVMFILLVTRANGLALACPGGEDGEPVFGLCSGHGQEPARGADWPLGSEFSHLISVGASNYDSDCNPWLTEDERELFFIRYSGQYGPADAGHMGSWDIYHCDWDTLNSSWGPSTNLGPNVNCPGPDRRPTTTVTGDTLLFCRSNSIYYSIRNGGEFGPTIQLFAGSDPCLSQDAHSLYFVRDKDIWIADRGLSGAIDDWVDHRELEGPINTGASEVRPFISRDDSLLIFSDFGGPRSGGYGDADLWVSEWTGGAWGEPANVGPPVNVDRPACTGWLSADAERLYAASEASEGSRGCEDIWIAHRDSTPEPVFISPSSGTWSKLGELAGAWHVYDLTVDADGVLYAATSPEGKVFRSIDQGLSWLPTADLPDVRIAYSLLATADGALFTGTYPNGDVLFTTDGGDTWQATGDIPGATAVRALLQTGSGRILAGTSPTCQVYELDAESLSWTQRGVTDGIQNSVTVLYEAQGGVLFAGGWGTPNVSPNGGQSWIPFCEEYGMASVEAFLEPSDGKLWMTGWTHDDGGFVAWSENLGMDWTTATRVTVDTLLSVRVYDIVETLAGGLMVGFQPGPDQVAALSDDGGLSWSPEGSLDGAHEILRFLKLDNGTIFAATTPNGDIFRWTPEGAGVGDPDAPDEEGPAQIGVAAVTAGRPNPFRSTTTIHYQLPDREMIDLSIVDCQGRRVCKLAGGLAAAGRHEARWTATDAAGGPVQSGIYFARLKAGESVTFQRLVLLRSP